MSILNSSIVPVGSTGYDIDNSLRFNDDDSAYLSRTPSTAGNRKTWTWSGWVKRGNLGVQQHIFSGGTLGEVPVFVYFNDSTYTTADSIWVGVDHPTAYVHASTTRKFRDVGAWYHIIVVLDTTQAVATNRIKLYVNGELIPSSDFLHHWSSAWTQLAQNSDRQFNAALPHKIGARIDNIQPLDGYLAEVNFIDGQALTPADFGETDEDYGHWKPIEYAGTYGTNGFYLNFVGNNELELTTFTDSSSSALTVTSRGAATHDGTYAKFGQSSLKLDGTNGYQGYCGGYNGTYEFPMSSSVGPNGSNSITFDCWIYQTSFLSTSLFFAIACDWYSPNFSIGSTGLIAYSNQSDGGSNNSSVTASAAITLNAWNHVACTIQNKTVKLWLNGAQVGSKTWTTGTWSNSGSKIIIGANGGGWLDEVRVSNTIRYSSTFTPETSAYTADGNTTFLMHSDVSTSLVGTLGADNSGNSNHWTPNNLAATDQMLDSPTNNFNTWNPLSLHSSNTLSEGNLKISVPNTDSVSSTMAMTTGKWYMEIYCVSGVHTRIGVINEDGYRDNLGATSDSWSKINNSARLYHNGSAPAYGAEWDLGQIAMVAFDADAGKIWYGVEGVWDALGNPATAANPSQSSVTGNDFFFATASGSGTLVYVANFGQDSSFAGNDTTTAGPYTDGGGIGDFYYAPPTGFLALCTQNLPEPAVVPSEHFNTVLYTGNGSTQSITGVGFQPDFFWSRARGYAQSNALLDVIRGVNSFLISNSTSAEADKLEFDTFDTDGFTVTYNNTYQYLNNNTEPYVAWNWKANGAGVSNTNGSINSTVSANVDAGFSIATWTGTSGLGTDTIGHGLSQAPELIISKISNTGDGWFVYHKDLTAGSGMYFNLQNAQAASKWPTAPTSTVFTEPNDSTNVWEHVTYCFHSVEGYSKVGVYTGNGSTDGPFVHCGFRPAYVIVKARDTAVSGWYIFDSKRNTYNIVDLRLLSNTTAAEAGALNTFDFTSNGFKLRDTNAAWNPSGGAVIFWAFAENPFKYTNAR